MNKNVDEVKSMFALWINNFERLIPEWEYDFFSGDDSYKATPQGYNRKNVKFAFEALVAMGED